MSRLRRRTIYYSDLDPDMGINPITNDVAATTNERAVNQSLIGIISTRKGERAFDSEYGCEITASLFENMSDLSAHRIERSIREAVTNHEPRAIIKAIDVLPIYDENMYIITIEYHLITDRSTIFRLKTALRDER